jgi:hypothetical protein
LRVCVCVCVRARVFARVCARTLLASESSPLLRGAACLTNRPTLQVSILPCLLRFTLAYPLSPVSTLIHPYWYPSISALIPSPSPFLYARAHTLTRSLAHRSPVSMYARVYARMRIFAADRGCRRDHRVRPPRGG